MDNLNLNHLRYFWAVARTGSIAGAARRLGVGRPAVSAQLASLEAELGVELFTRSARSVTLTDVGRELLRHADGVVAAAEELAEAAAAHQGPGRARLRLGLSPTLATSLVSRLLRPDAALEPFRIECHTASPARLVADLALRRLEAVVVDGIPNLDPDAQLDARDLGSHELTLLAPAPLAEQVERHGLDGLPLVLPARGSRIHDEVLAWFHMQGAAPRINVECDDGALAKRIGAAGHGGFVVPTPLAVSIAHELNVEVLRRLDGVSIPIHLITFAGGFERPELEHLRDSARTWLSAR